jgi:hypothetical protein
LEKTKKRNLQTRIQDQNIETSNEPKNKNESNHEKKNQNLETKICLTRGDGHLHA